MLTRRPGTGVWAGMWSLPEVADHDEARLFVARHSEADFEDNTPLPLIEHSFSHYRLHLQPLRVRRVALRGRVRDNDDLRWVARGELAKLGLPAPIRKLLDSL